jgi:hypothetical protein
MSSTHKAKAPRAPVEPTERDQGFNRSHGYGQGHGGPSGPGDVPAAPAEPSAPEPASDEDDEVVDAPDKKKDERHSSDS